MRSHTKILLISATAVVGVACIVVAVIGLWGYFSVTKNEGAYPSEHIITDAASVSENPVAVSDVGYEVPANQPRVINIPSLNVEGYIQKVAVDKSGAMSTPSNIYFAGWYTRSTSPGDAGLSIINGHVGGRYSDGLFKNLKLLKVGDAIRIQMGDRSWRDFLVVSQASYGLDEAQSALFADDPTIQNEVHFITCDGVFDGQAQTYDQRLIVVARRV